VVRWRRAPAKVNLTLRVIGRRADGYHELDSLVAFAGCCDWLGLESGPGLTLEVLGPRAGETGPLDENLVLRAARSLAAKVPGLGLGRFRLIKRLPAAAGLGGGSSDAAGALRLLADEAGLAADEPRLIAAARETGSDVLACLCPRARKMWGVGDQVGPALALPKIFAVLVNPGVKTPTQKVFAALGLAPGSSGAVSVSTSKALAGDKAAALDFLSFGGNDLEAAAIEVTPEIAGVLRRLSQAQGAKATRMSGSGATCFALFENRRDAAAARRDIAAERTDWWVAATTLR
jgi:4-diphosphocytidyl-2-C-methyl-D-erythritol kinase